MILDLGRFTRRGQMVDYLCLAETKGDTAQKKQRVQDQKGGGKRQRGHRPVCDGEVMCPYTQLHREIFQQS